MVSLNSPRPNRPTLPRAKGTRTTSIEMEAIAFTANEARKGGSWAVFAFTLLGLVVFFEILTRLAS